MDIATKLTDLTNDLRACRQAITEKGGEISVNAGFAEVAEKILEIPSGTSIGTVIDDTASLIKQVPVNSVNHCFVKSIGGMTYKCNNLIPFPYRSSNSVIKDIGYTETLNGITFTVLEDRGVKIVGTAEKTTYFGVCNINFSKIYSSYSVSQRCDLNINNGITSIYVVNGETIDTVVYPMVNVGATLLPYEPYFEGLQDTKPTAIKVSGANLIPFPYSIGGAGFTQTKGGITFTVNEDRSFTLKGTAQGTPAFAFASKLDLPTDVDYYLSGNCIGGEWVSGVIIYNQNYVSATNTTPTVKCPKGKKFAWISVQVPNGTTVDATFKPMLSRGQAVPYTPYHEPTIYPIPEALQGTGKGIEGASDTIDFEYGKKITKVKTIALGSRQSWQLGNYRSDTGIVSTYTYSVDDYDVALRSQSLCSHLSFTATQHNKLGIYIGDIANGLKRTVRVNVLADVVGLTADEYTDTAVIRDKIVSWLNANNVTLTYALAEPTEESLSVGFGLLPVEGGGSIEIITDNGRAIPNTIIYQTIV